jgi:hypothetical protein
MDESHGVLCKNCDNLVKNNYCDVCGQVINTPRINFSNLFQQALSIFNTDRGLLFTVRNLITRPGQMIKEYLAGKRACYSKPITFVFLFSTLYTLLSYWLNARITVEETFNFVEGDTLINNNLPDIELQSTVKDATIHITDRLIEFMYTYYAYIILFSIPVFAFFTYHLFRKSNYNHAEHWVINSYTMGMQVLAGIPLLFVKFYSTGDFHMVTSILPVIVIIWIYFRLFSGYAAVNRFFRALIAVIVSCVCIFILTMIITTIYTVFYFLGSGVG